MKLVRSLMITAFVFGFMIAMAGPVTACGKAKHCEQDLKKSDTNGDGKLDDTEKAAASKANEGKKEEPKQGSGSDDSSGTGSVQVPPL